jgi:hypothetical protein
MVNGGKLMKDSAKSWLAVSFTTALLTVGMAMPAQAQTPPINVTIPDGLVNIIAQDIDVNVSDIPVSIQVPVGIAANVCNVNAAVLLAAARQGRAECTAQETSEAFNEQILRSIED